MPLQGMLQPEDQRPAEQWGLDCRYESRGSEY